MYCQCVSLFVLSLALQAIARPADEKVSAADVHLNAVLPEAEISTFKSRPYANQAGSAYQSQRLELEAEGEGDERPTTAGGAPDVGVDTVRPPHSYFSRVITSIFEIPIAVLKAVSNLLQTTASVKNAPGHLYPSPN